jgi:hypothetical protein
MRQAWRVSDVRAAEKALMATLPEGTLMQRAAAGLARRCALLLEEDGGVYGARVVLLVGSGDNGGDTLYAGAALARRGAQVRALLLRPDRVHLAGLAALRAAAVSPYATCPRPPILCSTASWASVRAVACARPQPGSSLDWVICGPDPAGGRRWSRSMCRAASRSTPATCRAMR